MYVYISCITHILCGIYYTEEFFPFIHASFSMSLCRESGHLEETRVAFHPYYTTKITNTLYKHCLTLFFHSSIHIAPMLTWRGLHLCADVAGDQPPQHPAPRPCHHQRVRQEDVPIGDGGGGVAAARGGRRNLVRPNREQLGWERG